LEVGTPERARRGLSVGVKADELAEALGLARARLAAPVAERQHLGADHGSTTP
jgi:plasmid maintenance system antidote protein VapI